MRTKHLLIVLSIALALLLINKQWAVTSVEIPFFSVPFGKSRVDFINESGKKITHLDFSTSYFRTESPFTNIEPGQRVSKTFKLDSESLYQFRIIFEDGDTLVSREGYIEPGYFIEEYIKPDKIETEF